MEPRQVGKIHEWRKPQSGKPVGDICDAWNLVHRVFSAENRREEKHAV